MIRLLIVEDSKTVQQALIAIFSADPEIRVVGTAASGDEAVSATLALKPDVITMDINMPGMDGFTSTRTIMATCPTPIVIVTGKLDPTASTTLFRVMQAGALMVMGKPPAPSHPDYEDAARELRRTIRLMSEVRVVRRTPQPQAGPVLAAVPVPEPAPSQPPVRLVAIGASTGGPPLLQSILSALPVDFSVPVVIVQHMARGFTANFVDWLRLTSSLPVELATDGTQMLPGHAYVAPDDFHLQVGKGDRIMLVDAEPENGLRPAVSCLFRSVARAYGRSGVGVLLTGMGKDGAAELKAIRESGGVTIAQNRESSVVFGMPGEAIRLDAADYVLSSAEIPAMLGRLANGQHRLCRWPVEREVAS